MRRAFLLLLIASTAGAQVPAADRSVMDQWVFSLDGFGGLPVGDFKNYENGGGGGEGMLGFQLWRRQPAVLRVQGGGLLYSKVDAVAQTEVCDAFGCTLQDIQYNARDHAMYFIHAGPELMATDGTWRPFAYALAGYTFFNSTSNLPPSSLTPDQPSQTIFSSHNFSSVYGLGIRRVTTRLGRENGFELSFNVTRNAKARYLNERGVQQNPDGSLTIAPHQGAANVLGIHIGYWIGPNVRYWERR
ncbi:MAG TPA: hypothetical protein VJ867_03480 [Gemmatimonadaceae bacterium]|nr:hypothetical protein [Gemmatimonadaceae bacterium]